MPKIVVACHQPTGMHRGGKFNQGVKAYEVGEHTEEQLRELIACPHHSIVYGDIVTAGSVADVLAAVADKKAKKAGA